MKWLLGGIIFLVFACNKKEPLREVDGIKVWFDLQGHRGTRGLAPENTVPAFWKAITRGVTTLEMDLAVTGDGQLVVSHEPWFSHLYCRDSVGNPINEDEGVEYNIYSLTYSEVAKFDCGSIRNPNFPEQELVSTPKPTFANAVQAVEQYIVQKKSFPVSYNIEIKSEPEGDNIYHPVPKVFSDLVYSEIDKRLSWDRVTIQSFDFRVLQYFHDNYPDVKLAVLIGDNPCDQPGLPCNGDNGLDMNLNNLGFVPEIYSCQYNLLSSNLVDEIHEREMLVIPWTVNNIADMEMLYEWGVDGIITDYPNRFWETNIRSTDIIEFPE